MEWVSLILAGLAVIGVVLRTLNVIMIQFNKFLALLGVSFELLRKLRRFKRRKKGKRKKDSAPRQGK